MWGPLWFCLWTLGTADGSYWHTMYQALIKDFRGFCKPWAWVQGNQPKEEAKRQNPIDDMLALLGHPGPHLIYSRLKYLHLHPWIHWCHPLYRWEIRDCRQRVGVKKRKLNQWGTWNWTSVEYWLAMMKGFPDLPRRKPFFFSVIFYFFFLSSGYI